MPHIGDYIRTVCPFCNAFWPLLEKSSAEYDILAKRMLKLAKLPTNCRPNEKKNDWDSRTKAPGKLVDDTDRDDFPQLTEAEMRDMTMVVYQLKQADSYTEEHTDENGQYEIIVHIKEE